MPEIEISNKLSLEIIEWATREGAKDLHGIECDHKIFKVHEEPVILYGFGSQPSRTVLLTSNMIIQELRQDPTIGLKLSQQIK